MVPIESTLTAFPTADTAVPAPPVFSAQALAGSLTGRDAARTPVPASVHDACGYVRRARLDGSAVALRQAADVVRRQGCPDHAAAFAGRSTLLVQELVWQVLERRRRRPLWLALSCRGASLTVSVEVSGVRAGLFGTEPPDVTWAAVVRRIADEWGAEPVASGVRVWGRLDLSERAAEPR